MSLYTPRNRKVRGWRRRIKQVEAWKKYNLSIIKAIEFDSESIAVLELPWVCSTTLPVWMRRIILKAMLDIYVGWKAALQTTGEPCYIALWIFEPRFCYTQVLAARGEQISFFRDYIGAVQEDKPIATNYAEVLRNISNIRAYPHEVYYASEWGCRPLRDTNRMNKPPHRKIERHSGLDGSICYDYYERLGDVWVVENEYSSEP